MLVEYLKCKIHRATITHTEVDYEGSITIDRKLMDAAGLLPGEKVGVLNYQNRNRFETYVIEGAPGSGTIGLNGPAALLGEVGQNVVVLSYAIMTPQEAASYKPLIVYVDAKNNIKPGPK